MSKNPVIAIAVFTPFNISNVDFYIVKIIYTF